MGVFIDKEGMDAAGLGEGQGESWMMGGFDGWEG